MKIKWHKLKIWEYRFRRYWVAPATALTLVWSTLTYPTHAFEYQQVNEPVESPIVMTTDGQFAYPVAQLTGVSQGYHLLHAGMDLRAPKGTEIRAMSAGMVIEVKQMNVGYGHFVRVAHDGTVSTLYAHLDKVWVVPGQKVAKGQGLGTVGVTGWSTGPHLHFEVYEGNKAVNPARYINEKE